MSKTSSDAGCLAAVASVFAVIAVAFSRGVAAGFATAAVLLMATAAFIVVTEKK